MPAGRGGVFLGKAFRTHGGVGEWCRGEAGAAGGRRGRQARRHLVEGADAVGHEPLGLHLLRRRRASGGRTFSRAEGLQQPAVARARAGSATALSAMRSHEARPPACGLPAPDHAAPPSLLSASVQCPRSRTSPITARRGLGAELAAGATGLALMAASDLSKTRSGSRMSTGRNLSAIPSVTMFFAQLSGPSMTTVRTPGAANMGDMMRWGRTGVGGLEARRPGCRLSLRQVSPERIAGFAPSSCAFSKMKRFPE